MDFVNKFHKNAKLPKAITECFPLIPKTINPQKVVEFRSIWLIGSLYIITFKLLTTKLKKVVGFVILESQSTSIPNRQMFDGVLVINDLVDFAKRKTKECAFQSKY